MNNKLKSICDTTILNYRYSICNLRYDGDYINHFSALINGYKEVKINAEHIKSLRSMIKKKTPSMSAFRGDILYIITVLMANNKKDSIEFIDELLRTFDNLIKEDFKDCGHLVLAAYVITKYIPDESKRITVCKRMKKVFNIIKERYKSCTKQDDYLLCALISIEGLEYDYMINYMDFVFEYIKKLDLFTNNEIQGLTNSIVIKNNKNSIDSVLDLLIELEKNELKIGQQFLQLIGLLVLKQNISDYIYNIKEVLEYYSEEEAEYYFYIDKDFRNIIALVIVFMYNNEKDIKYVDELLAFGTYSVLISKNQSIFNEVLA